MGMRLRMSGMVEERDGRWDKGEWERRERGLGDGE